MGEGGKKGEGDTGGTPAPPLEPAGVAAAVEGWFRANARALPWRPDPVDGVRDPYRALVSEVMLQQTQVSRVLGRFGAFMERFPTAASLAAASDAEVLAAWSGLGYYRRARLLHAAARAVVDRHGGVFPSDTDALRALPGVGRYTAGALGSMVFERREAVVDGNVERVLLRLHANPASPKDAATQDWLWARAGELAAGAASPGVLNEGLMELGATVCIPAAPRCPACPLREVCAAYAQGRTDELPTPRARAARKDWFVVCFVVEDGAGRVLVETRKEGGLWAGMVQPPSVEGEGRIGVKQAAAKAGVRAGRVTDRFVHVTTHRRVHFVVARGTLPGRSGARRWVTRAELEGLALSNAHRRVFALA